MVTKTTIAVLVAGGIGAVIVIDRLIQGSWFFQRPPFTGTLRRIKPPLKISPQREYETYSVYGNQRPIQPWPSTSKYLVTR